MPVLNCVYLMQEGNRMVLLLVGGNKSSQGRDIKKAKRLAKKWGQEHEDRAKDQNNLSRCR